MKLRLLFLLLSFMFLSMQPGRCSESGGTLIVTYQTGPKAERLDRVRFWLKSPNQEPQLYPKGNNFAEDQSTLARIVVIESLRPGKYGIEFVVPNSDGLFEQLPKREVLISEGKVIKIDQMIKPRYASLKVKTSFEPNPSSSNLKPKASLQNQHGCVMAESKDGKFTANYLIPGKYFVIFEELPGFIAPPAMEVTLGPNQNFGPIEGMYINQLHSSHSANEITRRETHLEKMQKTVLVPEGKAIIGDTFNDPRQNTLPPKVVKISPFYIGIYEVTNFQYAQWLTRALEEGKITYQSAGEKPGTVTDLEGHFLFRTHNGDLYSQIFAENSQNKIHFSPQPGKHKHPVINVSWYGAQAYCKDNQCRLPTEAEWEKAAGMALTPAGDPLKKYRYGFSRNEIDRTWANYNYHSVDPTKFTVNTTPVGFYNGLNQLSKKDGNNEEKMTHLAISPVGAYDMSGNVWEWVADWYSDQYYLNMTDNDPQGPSTGTSKVAKGGCYDSFADGVRVSERIGLPPEHADPFTGFRVATDVGNKD